MKPAQYTLKGKPPRPLIWINAGEWTEIAASRMGEGYLGPRYHNGAGKSAFKKLIGNLYREGVIRIEANEIRLA